MDGAFRSRRGARHPGDPGQGDDGSHHLRRDDRARRRSSSAPSANPRSSSPTGMAPMTAASATPSPRASRSRAPPSSCANPPRSRTDRDVVADACLGGPGEIQEVARLFPEAQDYVDVYDRAGGLGARTILAHAVHLTDRELARLVETDTRVAHCPARTCSWHRESCPRPVPRGRPARRPRIGRRGGPIPRSSRSCRSAPTRRPPCGPSPASSGRPRTARLAALGTLDGARALGIDDRIGSIEAGKEADLIAVDPRLTAARRDLPYDAAASSRRGHEPADLPGPPDMVRAAWVRGRRLEGPSTT
jgi:hypothetical protein